MEWVIKKPQLKSLLLKETGFHNPTYLTEIKDILKRKTEMENEFSDELEKVEAQLKAELAKRNTIEVDIERTSHSVDQIKKDNLILENKALEVENNIKKVSSKEVDIKYQISQFIRKILRGC